MGSLIYFKFYHPNEVLKKLLMKYLGYSLVYILFDIPQLLLHFIAIRGERKESIEDVLKNFIYVRRINKDLGINSNTCF